MLLAIGAAISFAAWLLVPNAMAQLQQLSNLLPELKRHLETSGFGGLLLHLPGAERFFSGGANVMQTFTSMLTGRIASPLYAGLGALVGVFISIQPELYKGGPVAAAQMLLGFLVGPLGLIFAVPMLVLVKMLYVRDALGDPEGDKNVYPAREK
ncbi:MAG: hypothetical protein M1541_04510 [Acidobacteria bacterium]|nr:hypothetical protein [Acidobacteriota bacterium]